MPHALDREVGGSNFASTISKAQKKFAEFEENTDIKEESQAIHFNSSSSCAMLQ